jgi:hypothetical protein
LPEVAVTLKFPFATLCKSPDALTVAMLAGDAPQATVFVTSEAEPSVKVAIAVICCDFPRGIPRELGES